MCINFDNIQNLLNSKFVYTILFNERRESNGNFDHDLQKQFIKKTRKNIIANL